MKDKKGQNTFLKKNYFLKKTTIKAPNKTYMIPLFINLKSSKNRKNPKHWLDPFLFYNWKTFIKKKKTQRKYIPQKGGYMTFKSNLL